MRRWIKAVLMGIGITGLGGLLLLWILMAFGLMSVGISPLHSYELREDEAALLDAAHADLHSKMAKEQFDLILDDLVEARVTKERNIEEMRKAVGKFGAPKSFEFFRAAAPEPASKYYPDHEGTNYLTSYFTKADKSEFDESIDWIVDDSGRARIRMYSATYIAEWQKKDRDREKELDRVLPNEIKVPIPVVGYFINIRY
jgi:hypothetical protein